MEIRMVALVAFETTASSGSCFGSDFRGQSQSSGHPPSQILLFQVFLGHGYVFTQLGATLRVLIHHVNPCLCQI